jgi:hypothetical protein
LASFVRQLARSVVHRPLSTSTSVAFNRLVNHRSIFSLPTASTSSTNIRSYMAASSVLLSTASTASPSSVTAPSSLAAPVDGAVSAAVHAPLAFSTTSLTNVKNIPVPDEKSSIFFLCDIQETV